MAYFDIKKQWMKHELVLRKWKNYGDFYFVDATDGSDDYDGTDPGRPFKSLDYAVGQLTASHNDVIIHKGYENLSSGYVDVDVEKCSIYGWGLFGANPMFPEIGSLDRSTAEDNPVMLINADFVEVAGLAFNCEWLVDDVANQPAVRVANGANKAYIHDCFFPDWARASMTVGLELLGCHYPIVERCEFHSVYAYMDQGIMIRSAATQPAYGRIRDCTFQGMGTGGSAMTTGIDMSQPTFQNWVIERCNFSHVTNALKFPAAADLWGTVRNCVGSMTKGNFATGGSACDTIANAKTNYEVIMADIWGSDGPMTA